MAEEKNGASFIKISATAKENGIVVIYGYPEVDGSSGEEKYYNSAQFVDKNGCSLLNYRKVHPLKAKALHLVVNVLWWIGMESI